MEKYVYIRDISAYPSYKNVYARLLYLHVACCCDVSTYNYVRSTRQLASDLDMTHQNVRTALRSLERDGLVLTQQVTQYATRSLTQRLTQQLTQIHIVKITELNEATNEATNIATNTATNTAANTSANTQKNNIKQLEEERLSPTHAREHAEELAAMAAEVLRLARQEADFLLGEFLKRKEIERKTWTDEGDLKAHFLAWCEKNLKTLPKKRKNSSSDDHAARMEEYAATEERTKEQTEEEKDQETWGRMMRFAAECEAKKDEWRMLDFLASAHQLCEKWGWKKMSIQEFNKKQKERRKAK